MSGALVLPLIENVAEALVSILFRVPRGIRGPNAFIIPDAAVEETSRNDLQITEHPVELGSTISDHAFMKPREVTLRWSWSNSGLYGGYETAMQDIYQMLASLQAERQPLNIYTGKQAYQSMLIASLGVTTNESSEYAVQAIMVCREVIIVTTQTLQPGQAAQAVPQSTSVITNQGNVTPQQISAGSTLPNFQTAPAGGLT